MFDENNTQHNLEERILEAAKSVFMEKAIQMPA